ncbi:cell division protein FtsL [Streptococcus entericus]|uniref:cell division protein FtsL n=1 Tax=Streptococcus entericus TaxID=155680 RepID=UPI00037B8235|nr:cell division protein FtsL [Streptococcus entericus]
MAKEKYTEDLRRVLGDKIRTFSRIEKTFYLCLVITGIIMAVSVVYMQIRHQQLQQDITVLNNKINDQQDELNDAKQEVNELTRLERITDIVTKSDIKTQSGNLQKVD